MAERKYMPDDQLFALTSAPDLALQLTCEPGRWRVMVFEMATKTPALTGHYEETLPAAKRFAAEFVNMRYGLKPEDITWKEAVRRRGWDV